MTYPIRYVDGTAVRTVRVSTETLRRIEAWIFAMKMMYPASIKPEGRYFVVSFRDLPAAITQGHGFEEALEMAQDAAACALEMLAEQGANAPVPSAPHPGEVMVLPKRAE